MSYPARLFKQSDVGGDRQRTLDEAMLKGICIRHGIHLECLPLKVVPSEDFQTCAGVLLYRGSIPVISIRSDVASPLWLIVCYRLIEAFHRYGLCEVSEHRLRRKSEACLIASAHIEKESCSIHVHRERVIL